ncbi:hypothetical protein ACFE04_018519 [Oxalis oulophora]
MRLVHLVLSWLTVYKLGFEFVYIVKNDTCKLTWRGFSVKAFNGLKGFLKLSAASTVIFDLVACWKTLNWLWIHFLFDIDRSLQLDLDGCSVFMVVVGFNAATSVRVGNELGAGNPKSAAFSAITIILNGIQLVLSGVSVGCGWQTFVAYVNVGLLLYDRLLNVTLSPENSDLIIGKHYVRIWFYLAK